MRSVKDLQSSQGEDAVVLFLGERLSDSEKISNGLVLSAFFTKEVVWLKTMRVSIVGGSCDSVQVDIHEFVPYGQAAVFEDAWKDLAKSFYSEFRVVGVERREGWW